MLIDENGIEEILMGWPTTYIATVFWLIFREADIPLNLDLLTHAVLRFLKSLLLPDHFPFAFNLPIYRP